MPRADWSPRAPLRAHWSLPAAMTQRQRILLPALLYFTLLVGLPLVSSAWSSSELPPAPLDAELVRDAPLYPPLQHETEPSDDGIESTLHAQPTEPETVETDDVTNVQRDKRSSGQDWDKTSKPSGESRRVKTGDTILNIRGAVRDAIGDAGAAPGPRASSRLDTFVIRPAAARARPHPPPYRAPPKDQVPRHARELLVEAHARAHPV